MALTVVVSKGEMANAWVLGVGGLGAASQGFLDSASTPGRRRTMILVAAESVICTSKWTRLHFDIHSPVMRKQKQACGGRVPTVLRSSW